MRMTFVAVCAVTMANGQVPPAIAPLVLPTMAPPVPNIATIEHNFEQMQARIEQMTQRVVQINLGITEIMDMTHNTQGGIANADRDIRTVDGTAQANLLLVRQLTNESESAARVVEHAAAEMQDMKHFVGSVEQQARSMGGNSAEVARKLGEIESDVAEFLPSEGGFISRIEGEETTVQGYQGQVDDGLDKMVARSLRKNFKRSTGRIDDLALEVQAGTDGPGPAPAPAPVAAAFPFVR